MAMAHKRQVLSLLLILAALLSIHKAVSANSGLPGSIILPNFNLNTCEQDQNRELCKAGATQHQAFREQKQQGTRRLENAGYAENVKARTSKFPGFSHMLFESALMAGLAVFLFRRQFTSPRGPWIGFAAGTVALFLAQLSAGTIQIVTGIPTWLAFVLMLASFGVLYVPFRDKLNALFPDATTRATHGSAAWSAVTDAINASRLFKRGMVSADSYGFALGRLSGASANLDPRMRY